MLTGSLLTLSVGIFWAGIGIVLTSARRSGCRVEQFFFTGSLIAALLLGGVLTVQKALIPPAESWIVIAALAVGALLNGVSQMLTMRNLGQGGCALYFALSRMGFAVSFLWSVLVWGERMTVWNALGILCLISAVVLTASGKRNSGKYAERGRLAMAVLSTLCAGISQICIVWPSVCGMTEKPLPPLNSTLIILLMNCLFFGGWTLLRRDPPETEWRPLLRMGTAWGILAVLSYAVLFPALRQMGAHGRAGIVYPVGGAVLIFVYTLYTRFGLREQLSLRQAAALILVVIGVLAVKL